MPGPLLRAFSERADQIAAERALTAYSANAAASGTQMKRDERKSLLDKWRAVAARASS